MCKFLSPCLGLVLACAASAPAAEAPDRLFDPDKPLAVDTLVEAVLERNPGLEAARFSASEANFAVEPAGRLDDPMLSYGFAPETVGGIDQPNGARGLNQRIEVAQSFPWPGKLSLREEAARGTADAMRADAQDLRLEAIAAATGAFAEWHYIHRALKVNAENRALLEELREVTETRYAAGLGTQQDPILADAEHAALQEQALVFERERRTIKARINGLLARDPNASLPPPAELPNPSAPADFKTLRAAAVQTHPELKRLASELNVAKARTELADKNGYPDFRLTAGYNSLWDEDEKRWTLGVSINVPWDRGKYKSIEDSALAAQNASRWRLTDRRTQLLAELERARAESAESVDRIALYRDRLLPLAESALDAARADYRAGGGEFLNVIEAEKRKHDTELKFERARADWLKRRAALERWTGRTLDLATATMETQP